MLQPYSSPIERIWHYALRILCALILLFLIIPVLVIMPLSFNADSFLLYPMSGFSLRWLRCCTDLGVHALSLRSRVLTRRGRTSGVRIRAYGSGH